MNDDAAAIAAAYLIGFLAGLGLGLVIAAAWLQ